MIKQVCYSKSRDTNTCADQSPLPYFLDYKAHINVPIFGRKLAMCFIFLVYLTYEHFD